MPDDTYCACGDHADYTLTTGADRPQNLCARCTVNDVRPHLPDHVAVQDLPDENGGDAEPARSHAA